MTAFRVLNPNGTIIGTLTVNDKELESKIVNEGPEIRLGYHSTQTNIISFFLELSNPDEGMFE